MQSNLHHGHPWPDFPPKLMTRTVFCQKTQQETEGLDRPPWPGELGQRIYEHIGREAWQQWLAYQTMLINEHRLSPRDPATRAMLANEMQRFLFGESDG
ncbi:MAG: putative Fe(2+)-trafficking protein YggX [Rhodanobacteraceae bacterium]|nr:MAG: putative Fe(2+)-trafficking protein YggX [Rhodanobacteraceae bacterium]